MTTDTAGPVAVVGAGPAGLYTAAALVAGGAAVDVIDRLPVPFGLVRYGVAPDHVRMRSVAAALRRPLDDGRCGFLGDVELGRQVGLTDLRRHYRAVVLAVGCPRDRTLGVPGEDLPGCHGSGEVVAWYNGHPDALRPPLLDHPAAVVVGGGNVALDVARVLALPGAVLRPTDVPDAVLEELSRSRVRDVHVLVRRGPEEVRFTPAELRALTEVDSVDVLVHHELPGDTQAEADPVRAEVLVGLRRLAERPERGGDRRRIHLHFHRRVVALAGGTRVERVRHVDTRDADGAPTEMAAGLVVAAIGHSGRPLPGVPFDEGTGTVPHLAGRVLGPDGPERGLYVTGWLKRGPSGVIGTNKPCGRETAAAVLQDLAELPEPLEPGRLRTRLTERGAAPTSWQDWLRVERAEQLLGEARGAPSVKVARREDLTTLAAG